MSGVWIDMTKRDREDDATTDDGMTGVLDESKPQPTESLYKKERYPMYYDDMDVDEMTEEELRKFAKDMLRAYRNLQKWVRVN